MSIQATSTLSVPSQKVNKLPGKLKLVLIALLLAALVGASAWASSSSDPNDFRRNLPNPKVDLSKLNGRQSIEYTRSKLALMDKLAEMNPVEHLKIVNGPNSESWVMAQNFVTDSTKTAYDIQQVLSPHFTPGALQKAYEALSTVQKMMLENPVIVVIY